MDPVHATDNNYLLNSDDNFCSGGESQSQQWTTHTHMDNQIT